MSPQNKHTLRMERLFDAPPKTVFDYFTDPKLMKTWWSPGGTTMLDGTIDLREGGHCRWKMQTEAGKIVYLNGVIKALSPPSLLVLTHHWEGAGEYTVVTLQFVAQGEQTKLLLTQEGISARTMLAALKKGWAIPLAQLESQLSKRGWQSNEY